MNLPPVAHQLHLSRFTTYSGVIGGSSQQLAAARKGVRDSGVQKPDGHHCHNINLGSQN
jgi:hypothetical protein